MEPNRFTVIRQDGWDGAPFFLVFDREQRTTVGPRHETYTDALDYIDGRVNPVPDPSAWGMGEAETGR